ARAHGRRAHHGRHRPRSLASHPASDRTSQVNDDQPITGTEPRMHSMTESESRSERDTAGGESADVVLARSQAQMAELAAQHGANPEEGKAVVLGLEDVAVSYSGHQAVRGVDMNIHKTLVTAFIGPSGCGKTTL